MTSTMPTAREALAEASDFARDVWRDCWPVMLVVIVGRTLVFLGHHVSAVEWRPGAWPLVGDFLTLAYVPLFGALYRLGVGGPALDSLGWGGFQWTAVEWRLLGVWVVLGFALAICATPLAIVSFPLLYLLQHHAAVSLGPFGGWSLASILLAPFWLAFAAFVLFMWSRLGLAAARTTARERVSPFASWGLTRGMGWTIGLAWLVTQLPMVFGWIGLWAMGLAEAGDVSTGPAEVWPLADALGAGVVVAALAIAIQVPLSVGLLSGFYRWLSEDTGEAVATPHAPDHSQSAGELVEDDPAPASKPESEPEQEPVSSLQALSVWPHTVLPRSRKSSELETELASETPTSDLHQPFPLSLDLLKPELPDHDAPELAPRGADQAPAPVFQENLAAEFSPEQPAAPDAELQQQAVNHLIADDEPPTSTSDAEPPLASAPEPDQITGPHDLTDGPEPHA